MKLTAVSHTSAVVSQADLRHLHVHRVTGLKSKCLHPSCSLADVAPLFLLFEHVALPPSSRRRLCGARLIGASLARRRSDELD